MHNIKPTLIISNCVSNIHFHKWALRLYKVNDLMGRNEVGWLVVGGIRPGNISCQYGVDIGSLWVCTQLYMRTIYGYLALLMGEQSDMHECLYQGRHIDGFIYIEKCNNYNYKDIHLNSYSYA